MGAPDITSRYPVLI